MTTGGKDELKMIIGRLIKVYLFTTKIGVTSKRLFKQIILQAFTKAEGKLIQCYTSIILLSCINF